jgi:galactitol-specific phosphotransferase system IIB component
VSWIAANIRWILIVCGVATSSMLAMAVAPRFTVRYVFGEQASGAVSDVMARTWGVMIFASGAALIYAAFDGSIRLPVIVLAIIGKGAFSASVLSTRLRRQRAFAMALADLAMVALFAWYLAAIR